MVEIDPARVRVPEITAFAYSALNAVSVFPRRLCAVQSYLYPIGVDARDKYYFPSTQCAAYVDSAHGLPVLCTQAQPLCKSQRDECRQPLLRVEARRYEHRVCASAEAQGEYFSPAGASPGYFDF